MPPDVRSRALRAVPLGLALALIATVVLAGLLPGSGVVSASSSCTYGACPASSSFPYWAVGVAAAVVVAALIGALLLLRRRKPPAATDATAPAGTNPEAPAEPQGQDPSTGAPPEPQESYGTADDPSAGGPSP